MACCGAREIHDGDVVLVGTGFPTVSANIARYTHAPNARLMQESGVFDAQPKRPALSVGDPCLNPGAAMIGSLLDIMGMFLQAGCVDVGFLSGSQVDKYGNINTTVIGDYASPKSRLPGSGGANPIGSLARRVIIIALRHAPAGREGGLHHHAGLHRRPGSREVGARPTPAAGHHHQQGRAAL
jgi:glutaconate CoA-transferase subunit B